MSVVLGDVMSMNESARLDRRPTWELIAMVKALSLHCWLNTHEENERLRVAKLVLKKRKARKCTP
jgi:hypothetical protein